MQTSAAPKAHQTQLIPIEKIKPSPNNARKDFATEYITSLAASIERDGLQQPPKVRPVNGHFELVYGECRVRAHDLLKRKEVECFVEQMDDTTAERVGLIENIKRRDLSPFEEARELKRLQERSKLRIEDLAQQVGLAVRTVRENIKLAALAPDVEKLALGAEPQLKLSLAKLISRLPRAEDQVKLAKRVVGEKLTHEETEQLIREEYMADLRHAPFDVKQKGLACVADTCAVCPRNAKNMKDELPDYKGGDACTSLEHYRKKVFELAKKKAAEAGTVVMADELAAKTFNRWGELDPGASFVRADAMHPRDTKSRMWRELLSKDELKKRLIIAVSPRNEVLELLAQDGIELAVKAAGRLASSNKADRSPQQKAADRKADEADALRERALPIIIGRIVEHIEKKGAPLGLLRTVAEEFANNATSGVDRRRGWDSGDGGSSAITKMTKPNELIAVIWESALYGIYNVYDGYNGDLEAHAKLCGVDPRKVEKELITADATKEKAAKAGVVLHTKKAAKAKKK